MHNHPRVRAMLWLAGGMLLGQLIGPAVAWAADRVELNWPSVFRIEANRTLPFEVEDPVEVKIDKYSLPTFTVKVEEMPPVKVQQTRSTSFSPLYDDGGSTVFVAGEPDGECTILRVDHASGKVTPVSTFEL